MDKLASEGVILNRNYGQPICSPARAALMSGIYPWKLGRQVNQFSKIAQYGPNWTNYIDLIPFPG